MGDRRQHLRDAVAAIPDVVAVSPVYETAPVGGPDQGAYLNIVVGLETGRSPRELLEICRACEAAARHGASVERDTRDARQAYAKANAGLPRSKWIAYSDGWLPER